MRLKWLEINRLIGAWYTPDTWCIEIYRSRRKKPERSYFRQLGSASARRAVRLLARIAESEAKQ